MYGIDDVTVEQQRTTRAALLYEEELLATKILDKMRRILPKINASMDNISSSLQNVIQRHNDQFIERIMLIRDVSNFDRKWFGKNPKTFAEVIEPYVEHVLKLILFYRQLKELQIQHNGESFEQLRARYPYAILTNERLAFLRTELIERALLLLNPNFDLGFASLPLRFIKISRVIDEVAKHGPNNVSKQVLKKEDEPSVASIVADINVDTNNGVTSSSSSSQAFVPQESKNAVPEESTETKALRTFLQLLGKETNKLMRSSDEDVERCVSELAKVALKDIQEASN